MRQPSPRARPPVSLAASPQVDRHRSLRGNHHRSLHLSLAASPHDSPHDSQQAGLLADPHHTQRDVHRLGRLQRIPPLFLQIFRLLRLRELTREGCR